MRAKESRLLLVIIFIAEVNPANSPAEAADYSSREIELRTPDGYKVSGTYYLSADYTYSVNSCRKLQSVSTGAPIHLEIYDGEAHGTDLISGNKDFEHFLSDWFLSTL